MIEVMYVETIVKRKPTNEYYVAASEVHIIRIQLKDSLQEGKCLYYLVKYRSGDYSGYIRGGYMCTSQLDIDVFTLFDSVVWVDGYICRKTDDQCVQESPWMSSNTINLKACRMWVEVVGTPTYPVTSITLTNIGLSNLARDAHNQYIVYGGYRAIGNDNRTLIEYQLYIDGVLVESGVKPLSKVFDIIVYFWRSKTYEVEYRVRSYQYQRDWSSAKTTVKVVLPPHPQPLRFDTYNGTRPLPPGI